MLNVGTQFAITVAVVLVAGCGEVRHSEVKTGVSAATSMSLLKPCRIKGVENEVKCGTLEVIERREAANPSALATTAPGRKIGINIVVLPATARVKEPDPIFLFAGGPGQAAASLAPQAMLLLGGLNGKRDIVLIDQRGTGKSNGLICKMPDISSPAIAGLNKAARDAKLKQMAIECRDVLAISADLTQYTTTFAMADYDEVRQALGYEKINLWGASYGTRSAMEYLRRYPEHVRSVVIDGVAPPSMALPIDFARDAGAAYEKVLAACEQETSCHKNFPMLRKQIIAALAGLAKAPRKTMLADPLTGFTSEVEVTRDLLLIAIFSALYVPEMAAELPAALNKAVAGDYAMLMALSSMMGDMADDQVAFGMRLSVMCAEDVPRLSPALVAAEANRTPFGRLFIDEFAKACDFWPKGKMAPDFDQPVKSDKPVLILSGGLDPVTPAVHGEEVKKSLTNAVHFIAPNAGHGVAHKGCAPKIVKKFIELASVAGLDGECLKKLPRPIFYEPLQEKKLTGTHRVQKANSNEKPGENGKAVADKGRQP